MIDWFKIAAGVAVLALLTAAGWKVWDSVNHWENAEARKWKAIAEACQQKQDMAQAREDNIARAYLQLVKETDGKLAEERTARDAHWQPLLAAAEADNRRLVALSARTQRLLNDASRAANARNPAAVAEGSHPAADPVPEPSGTAEILVSERDLATFVVAAGRAYDDAVGQWAACVNFYQDAKAKESP